MNNIQKAFRAKEQLGMRRATRYLNGGQMLPTANPWDEPAAQPTSSFAPDSAPQLPMDKMMSGSDMAVNGQPASLGMMRGQMKAMSDEDRLAANAALSASTIKGSMGTPAAPAAAPLTASMPALTGAFPMPSPQRQAPPSTPSTPAHPNPAFQGIDFGPHGTFTAGQGMRTRFYRGGEIDGPGTGTSDSIKASSPHGQIHVSDGEYILPEKTVKMLGKENIDDMVERTTGQPPNNAGLRRGGHYSTGASPVSFDKPWYVASTQEDYDARMANTTGQGTDEQRARGARNKELLESTNTPFDTPIIPTSGIAAGALLRNPLKPMQGLYAGARDVGSTLMEKGRPLAGKMLDAGAKLINRYRPGTIAPRTAAPVAEDVAAAAPAAEVLTPEAAKAAKRASAVEAVRAANAAAAASRTSNSTGVVPYNPVTAQAPGAVAAPAAAPSVAAPVAGATGGRIGMVNGKPQGMDVVPYNPVAGQAPGVAGTASRVAGAAEPAAEATLRGAAGTMGTAAANAAITGAPGVSPIGEAQAAPPAIPGAPRQQDYGDTGLRRPSYPDAPKLDFSMQENDPSGMRTLMNIVGQGPKVAQYRAAVGKAHHERDMYDKNLQYGLNKAKFQRELRNDSLKNLNDKLGGRFMEKDIDGKWQQNKGRLENFERGLYSGNPVVEGVPGLRSRSDLADLSPQQQDAVIEAHASNFERTEKQNERQDAKKVGAAVTTRNIVPENASYHEGATLDDVVNKGMGIFDAIGTRLPGTFKGVEVNNGVATPTRDLHRQNGSYQVEGMRASSRNILGSLEKANASPAAMAAKIAELKRNGYPIDAEYDARYMQGMRRK